MYHPHPYLASFLSSVGSTTLSKIWRKRIKSFCFDAFDEILTFDIALHNDRSALDLGFIRQLPGTYHLGGAIAHIQPSILDRSKYTKEEYGESRMVYDA